LRNVCGVGSVRSRVIDVLQVAKVMCEDLISFKFLNVRSPPYLLYNCPNDYINMIMTIYLVILKEMACPFDLV
jgi:hypothetical protein